MVLRWRGAPLWALLVANGVLVAVVVTGLGLGPLGGDRSVASAGGAAGGLAYALCVRRWLRRLERGAGADLLGLTDEQALAGVRAARRPSASHGEEVLRAALLVEEFRLGVLERQRDRALIAYGALCLVFAALAVTSSPWWWLWTALLGGLLGLQRVQERRTRHRVGTVTAALAAGGAAPGAGQVVTASRPARPRQPRRRSGRASPPRWTKSGAGGAG